MASDSVPDLRNRLSRDFAFHDFERPGAVMLATGFLLGGHMQDWKTTLAGVLTIVITLATAGLAYLHGQPINTASVLTAVTAGVGLIHASDSGTNSNKKL
jgi:hypothetical protein